MTAPFTPSRAHRRFLRTLAPLPAADTYAPITRLSLGAPLRRVTEQHLATAGTERSGLLLGWQAGETLQITHLLPSGYPPHLGTGSLDLDAGYVLGAVDAARQGSGHALDWVGHWIMAADAQPPSLGWCLHQYEQARRRALVGPDIPLLVFGAGEEQTELLALIGMHGQRSPHFIPAVWGDR